MSGWERTLAEALFDGAVRLAVVAFVADIATRRLVKGAPGAVHTIWRIVAGSALLIPAIVAIVPATVFIQPSASAFRLVNDAGESNAVRLAVFAALLGTAFGVCRLLIGLASMSALVRRSRLLSGDDERQLLSGAAGSSTAERPAVLLESDRIAVPVTFGFLRPCVLLPPGWRGWERSRLDAVMVHEMAHVQRADYAAGLVAALLKAIWWWHPAAWIIGKRLSLTAELACDARASAGIGPVAYASELLAVTRESGGRRLRYGWMVGAGSRLSARIDALLDIERLDRPTGPSKWGTGVAFGVVVAVLAAACAGATVRFTPLARSAPAAWHDNHATHRH